MFSLTEVLISTFSGGVVSLVVLLPFARCARNRAVGRTDAMLIAMVVGLSILLFSEVGQHRPTE
jgi:hypothetical protein